MHWISFLLGLFIGTPTALIIFALLKIQPNECHCCPADSTEVRKINGVKYLLCAECAREFDRIEIRNEARKLHQSL